MKKGLALLLCLILLLNGCAKPQTPPPQETVTAPADTTPEEQRVKQEWRDTALTYEQRKEFYNLVVEYRMDAVPEFKAGDTIEMDWMKYYCIHFLSPNEREYVSGGTNLSGAAVEKIAKERFGMSYGLKEGDVVFIKAEGGKSEPMAELLQYKTSAVNGETVVTARYAEIYWNEYMNYNAPDQNPNYYDHREQLFSGTPNGYDYYRLTDISYTTQADGKTPKQFLSAMTYGYESLRDGSQTLPDFSSL